jgi:hypothetical protein
VLSTNRLEDLKISDAQRAEIRRWVFYEPLPFVRRVVFIATPHRGLMLGNRGERRDATDQSSRRMASRRLAGSLQLPPRQDPYRHAERDLEADANHGLSGNDELAPRREVLQALS